MGILNTDILVAEVHTICPAPTTPNLCTSATVELELNNRVEGTLAAFNDGRLAAAAIDMFTG